MVSHCLVRLHIDYSLGGGGVWGRGATGRLTRPCSQTIAGLIPGLSVWRSHVVSVCVGCSLWELWLKVRKQRSTWWVSDVVLELRPSDRRHDDLGFREGLTDDEFLLFFSQRWEWPNMLYFVYKVLLTEDQQNPKALEIGPELRQCRQCCLDVTVSRCHMVWSSQLDRCHFKQHQNHLHYGAFF